MRMTDHTDTINGNMVHYWEAGNPEYPAVILVHGGIGDAKASWSEVIPDLSDEYHILAPDLPGFGGSSPLSSNIGIRDLTSWLADFMSVKDLEEVVMVGNSFGALLTRAFGTFHPEHCAGIVLMNGGVVPDVPAIGKLLFRMPVVGSLLLKIASSTANGKGSLNRMVHQKAVLTDEFVASAKANAGGFARLMGMTVSQPLPNNMIPTVPTLILWGTEDTVPVSTGRKLQARIPEAQLNEIADCGHMPQLEAPDVFIWQLKGFLKKHQPKIFH